MTGQEKWRTVALMARANRTYTYIDVEALKEHVVGSFWCGLILGCLLAYPLAAWVMR